jgi:hypothetical protein
VLEAVLQGIFITVVAEERLLLEQAVLAVLVEIVPALIAGVLAEELAVMLEAGVTVGNGQDHLETLPVLQVQEVRPAVPTTQEIVALMKDAVLVF